MLKKIVYCGDDGTLCILEPTPDAMRTHTIDSIAKKDVPAGKPYRIIDGSDIPTDRSVRNAWFVSEDDLTGGIGGVSCEFD